MLDIKRIREERDRVARAVELRGRGILVDEVIALDDRRKSLLSKVEQMKSERNSASKKIGMLMKAGEDATAAKQAVRDLGDEIKVIDEALRDVQTELRDKQLSIPNVPHVSVPEGENESHNLYPRSWGEKRDFDFKPLLHGELGDKLNLFDFERAAKMTGAGFPLFRGAGARLERALINFMLDLHVNEHDFEEMSPPFVCNADAMTGTGQLPKMAEDMYTVPIDGLYLVPTAEVPVTNYYLNEIISDELPISFTAYTPCFRREAGAAGSQTRGLNRVHQFDKVEMVKFVKPETSYDVLEELLGCAEDVLRRLELPYRICELCEGDLSFAAAKCYDIELWAPGQEAWLEVSSVSNFEDYQARRANIRYRNDKGKPTFVHTLNGSGVACPRLMIAILENYQQEDGSVLIPKALQPYMGGLEKIEA